MQKLQEVFIKKFGNDESYMMTQAENVIALAQWREGKMMLICRKNSEQEMIDFLENPNLPVLCANLREAEDRKKFLKKIENDF